MRGFVEPAAATTSGERPGNMLKLLGRYVNVARPVSTALIIADVKNERLIAFIALLSLLRIRVRKMPRTAVIVPMAGTMSG